MTAPRGTAYAELQVTTHFSFLRGASSVEELFAEAALLGIGALGITDRHSLAGIVRAHEAAKVTGVRAIIGCRLDLIDGAALLVYPTDRAAYGRLCRLLTLGKGRAGKGGCALSWDDVVAHGEGLIAILVPDRPDAVCAEQLRRLAREFRDRAYLALSLRRRPGDQLRLHELSNMAAAMRVATVATNDVLFHSPERRMLQDVVTCIREGVTIDDAGFRRERHADRHLKRPAEMARLFARWPEAVARSIEIAGCVRFSLDDLAYQYPDETSEPGLTAQQTLTRLTWEGAAWRYPEGIPGKIVRTLEHELHLIDELGYAPYFLTVHAIVRFARSRGILCQGRGSAANSAVCFVLGITAIDPERHDLLFERFVSQERQRAARHRCRFRARAARGSDPMDLRDLWPRPGGAVRHGDPLPRARRGARCRQGARAAGGHHRRAGLPGLGLEPRNHRGRTRGRAEPQSRLTAGCA